MSPEKKIIGSYEELERKVQALKILGKIIVSLSGTWDLLHVGHARYLESAVAVAIKIFGKHREDIILIVGVDNDKEVKVRKGKYRPIVPQDERLEMLNYIGDVDYVILKREEEQSWHLVELIKPDLLILSETTTFVNEERDGMLSKLRQWAGEIQVLPPQATTSTTGKIRTLLTGTVADIREKFDRLYKEFSSFLEDFGGG